MEDTTTNDVHHLPNTRPKFEFVLRPNLESSVFCKDLHCQMADANSAIDVFHVFTKSVLGPVVIGVVVSRVDNDVAGNVHVRDALSSIAGDDIFLSVDVVFEPVGSWYEQDSARLHKPYCLPQLWMPASDPSGSIEHRTILLSSSGDVIVLVKCFVGATKFGCQGQLGQVWKLLLEAFQEAPR